MDSTTDRFLEAAQQHGMWSTPARLHTYCQYLYRDVPLNGMQVLDIGAGSGVFSLYAAAAGASRVVCLEPEAAGSLEGKLATFGRVVEASGIQSVEMRDVTLQDYDSGGERFDLLLLHGSINHLDEPACIELRKNPEALRTYEGLFASMAELTAPGGHLLLVDATSDNLWPRLGLKNPMAPWIEWHKHQPPEVWRRLAEAEGFRYCCTQWSTPSVLGSVGRVLLGNRIGAYLTLGAFRLHLRKPV